MSYHIKQFDSDTNFIDKSTKKLRKFNSEFLPLPSTSRICNVFGIILNVDLIIEN